MNRYKYIWTILILILILYQGSQAQTLGIRGQASVWMTLNPEKPLKTQLGIRYIPEITIEKEAEVKIKELNTKFLDLKTEISELLTENKKDKGIQTIEITPKINDEKKDENDLDSIYIFDENANILDCNENMYKKLGYSKNEMLSLNITDFDALETQQDLKEKINQAKKNGNYSFKTIHRRKDGSTVPVYEVFEYIKDKNAFKCIVKEDYPLRKAY